MCTNCDVLRKRVRELEFELGHRINADHVPRLREAFKLHLMPAMAVSVLYDAKGRWTDSDRIMSAVGFASEASLRTSMCRARRLIGQGSIMGLQKFGYRLSDSGMARVTEALK